MRWPASYRAAVAGLAFGAAGWVYWNSTRPYLRCPDGHCPDPGSREYLHAVEVHAAVAPIAALAAFVFILLLGRLAAGLFAALRRRSGRE